MRREEEIPHTDSRVKIDRVAERAWDEADDWGSETVKQYFVIQNLNGDTLVYAISKEELLQNLNASIDPEYRDALTTFPGGDTSDWEGRPLIIEGRMIVPKAVERVTEWTIEEEK